MAIRSQQSVLLQKVDDGQQLQSIVGGPNPADTLANGHPFSAEQPIFVRHFFKQNVVNID